MTSSYFGNHAVRTREWRLIAYEDGNRELYDHRTDEREQNNLANDPSFSAKLDELAAWLPSNAAPEYKAKSERFRNRSKPE